MLDGWCEGLTVGASVLEWKVPALVFAVQRDAKSRRIHRPILAVEEGLLYSV